MKEALPRSNTEAEPNVDSEGVQVSSVLDQEGRFEYPDPYPVSPPVPFRKSLDPLDQLIKQYVRRELSNQAQEQGAETFEEADDFDIPDDPLDPLTEYERVFDFPEAAEGERGPPKPPPGKEGGVSPPPTAPNTPAASDATPVPTATSADGERPRESDTPRTPPRPLSAG